MTEKLDLVFRVSARTYGDLKRRADALGISAEELALRYLGDGMDGTAKLKKGEVIGFRGPKSP